VRLFGSGLLALSLWMGACASGRDVIPETHDVRGAQSDATRLDAHEPRDPAGYEYIAKRKLSVVGLAEGRGIDREVTARIVEALADSFEVCAENLSNAGKLVDGAARIAAAISPRGTPIGLALKLSPGPAVTANALLCFISPFKLTSFPAAGPDAPPRGLAVEATWGPHLKSDSPQDPTPRP
jgi:hypothetical protein